MILTSLATYKITEWLSTLETILNRFQEYARPEAHLICQEKISSGST